MSVRPWFVSVRPRLMPVRPRLVSLRRGLCRCDHCLCRCGHCLCRCGRVLCRLAASFALILCFFDPCARGRLLCHCGRGLCRFHFKNKKSPQKKIKNKKTTYYCGHYFMYFPMCSMVDHGKVCDTYRCPLISTEIVGQIALRA